MHQQDAGRNLVYVLSAMTARANERFLEFAFTDIQRGHALCKQRGFLGTDRI